MCINIAIQTYNFKPSQLDDGLDESPTVTVEEDNKLGKNRGILKPSLAFVKTKRRVKSSLIDPLSFADTGQGIPPDRTGKQRPF